MASGTPRNTHHVTRSTTRRALENPCPLGAPHTTAHAAPFLTIRWWHFLRMKKPESANCHYCYRLLRRDHITFDHMTPRIAGGKRNRGNLVVACPLCNLCKGHTHYTIFLIQIAFVPIDPTVTLILNQTRKYYRQWLRRVRSLRLENLATYDVRIAGAGDAKSPPTRTVIPITSSAPSVADGDHSPDATERSRAASLSASSAADASSGDRGTLRRRALAALHPILGEPIQRVQRLRIELDAPAHAAVAPCAAISRPSCASSPAPLQQPRASPAGFAGLLFPATRPRCSAAAHP